MSVLRGTPQAPPADFATRDLSDRVVSIHGDFWRISREKAPLLDWSHNGEARFSHSSLPSEVLYLANTKETGFWERFGEEIRDQPLDARSLSRKLLAERVWKSVGIAAATPLRCFDLRDIKTLRRIGADASTFFANYAVTQTWARALMEHPAQIDGIQYLSRFNSPEWCVAVFNRPHLVVTPGPIVVAVHSVKPLADPILLTLLVNEKIALVT